MTKATHIQTAKAAMFAVDRLLSDATGHQTDLRKSLAALARTSTVSTRQNPVDKAFAVYQREVSPEGKRETVEIYKNIRGGPFRKTDADLRFDAMETLRDALTEEIERLPTSAQ
jgi:hypothetical protein